MSKRKDRERAKQFVYRDGKRIPRHIWDEQQRKLREAGENERLAKLGLTRGKTIIIKGGNR